MTRRRLVLPALLVALSACSGDEGAAPGTAAEQTPSYAEVREAYVEQASEICERADADFAALPQPTTPAEFGTVVQDTVRIAEEAQRELSALTPPEPDRAELEDAVLEPFAALVEDAQAFAGKVTAAGTDQAQLLGLLAERPTSAGIDLELLRSYDLGVCADAIAKAG